MSPSEKLCPHGQRTVPIVVGSSHPHYCRCTTIRASRTRMTSWTSRGIPGILLMRLITFASSDGLTAVLLSTSTNRSACTSFLASCPTTRLTLLVAGEKTSKGTPSAPVPRAPPTRKSDVRTPCTPASPAAIRKWTCNPAARKAFAASISAAAAVSPPRAARTFRRISEPPEINPLFATTRAPLLVEHIPCPRGNQLCYPPRTPAALWLPGCQLCQIPRWSSQLELQLECAVRHPAATSEEIHNLVEHIVKIHHR